MELDEVLAHYGVPGMKWGVRNERKSSYNAKTSKGRYDPKDPNAPQTKTINLKDVPDDELRKIVNRMQLEQQYATLATKQTATTNSGKKIANEIVKNAGKQEATKLVAKGMSLAVAAALAAVTKKGAISKAQRYRGFDPV